MEYSPIELEASKLPSNDICIEHPILNRQLTMIEGYLGKHILLKELEQVYWTGCMQNAVQMHAAACRIQEFNI